MNESGNGLKFLVIFGVAFFILFSSALIGTVAYLSVFDFSENSAVDPVVDPILPDPTLPNPTLPDPVIDPILIVPPDFSDSEDQNLPSVSSTTPDTVFDSSDSYVRTYSWTYNGYSQSITLAIPKEYYEYYRSKPHYGKSFDNYALSENDRQLLKQMIDGFIEQGEQKGFTDDQNVLNVISFVQAMPYTSDNVTTGYDEYPRYPIETLVDGGGDCEDSSILAAALLTEMGYGTVLLGFSDHMALGVMGSENITGSYYTYNGSRYYYVETTSSDYALGEVPYEYKNSRAQIYTMSSMPVIYATMKADPIGSDWDYVYYRVRCNFTNNGPTTAKNVSVQIFAESSPYDMTRIWPPEHDIFIGDVHDDGSGWAEATVKIPRDNYTRFSCVIYGDNFNYADVHTKVVYIN